MGIQETRTKAWEAYKERLEWSRIAAAIDEFAASKPDVHSFDIETARKCVYYALERWLAEDIANCTIEGVEEPFEDPFKRGVIDVILRIRPEPSDSVYTPHANQLLGVDWKTSKNTLGSDWRDRYIYSWQAPTYVDGIARKYSLTPALFQYRGVSRSFETKPILLEVKTDPAPSVEVQYGGLRVMRDALISAGLSVWPKNMPSGCRAYGSECAYFADCTHNTEPRYVPEPKIFSFSGASTFLLCPEKYRRNMVDGSQDSEESIFGNLVHVGLAEAYKQAALWEESR